MGHKKDRIGELNSFWLFKQVRSKKVFPATLCSASKGYSAFRDGTDSP